MQNGKAIVYAVFLADIVMFMKIVSDMIAFHNPYVIE